MLEYSRTQSPSSINTYKQCPRKYYYKYIAELELLPNVHQIRGKCTHSVLEDFFLINPKIITGNYDFVLRTVILDLLRSKWELTIEDMKSQQLDTDQLQLYFEETKAMVLGFLENFLFKLEREMKEHSFTEAFFRLTPITEEEYVSERYGVRGFIDAVHHLNNEVRIIDYKTSKSDHVSQEIRLQLAIYSLLYFEKHGQIPDKAGINFLKFGEREIKVDETLLNFAKTEIRLIHEKTISSDINDYRRTFSRLCSYATGKCDFFEVCNEKDFKQPLK